MRLARITSEALFFGGAVTAAHLAFFAPQLESGLQSAGDAGEDLLQMMASNASIAALVEAWDAPPKVVEAAEVTMQQPASSPDAPPPMVQKPAETAPQTLDVNALNLPSADGPPLPVAPAAQAPALQSQIESAPAMAQPAPPTPPQTSPSEVVPSSTPPKMPEQMDAPTPEAAPKAPTSPPPPKPPAAKPEKKPTAEKSAQDSIKVNARRAKGEGGKTAKGNNGVEKTATVSDSKRKSLARKWGQQIRARIAQRAPRGAGKGKALVRITVAADGSVSGISLLKGSGNTRLDKLALKAVRSAGRMPKAPAGLGLPSLKINIPISSK